MAKRSQQQIEKSALSPNKINLAYHPNQNTAKEEEKVVIKMHVKAWYPNMRLIVHKT